MLSWIIVVVKLKHYIYKTFLCSKSILEEVLRRLVIFRFLKTSDGVLFFYKFKANGFLKLLKYANLLPQEVIF